MKNLKRKQSGMTMIGWLFVLVLIGFFAMLFIRLWPIYYENMGVKRAVNSVVTNGGTDQTVDIIWKSFERQFTIDQVNNVKREHLKLEVGESGKLIIRVEYEVRVPMMFNVDAVVYFKEKAELPQR